MYSRPKSIVAAVGLIAMQPLAAAPPAPTLAPSSSWNMHYADDSCRLTRTFGKDAELVAVMFDRFEPGDSFMITVAGSPLAKHNSDRTLLRFGPGDNGSTRDFTLGSLAQLDPALFSAGTKLVVTPEEERRAGNWRESANAALKLAAMNYTIAPATEASITWLEVVTGKRTTRLDLGPMDKPMEAMRRCTEELMTHWGIDVAAHRDLTRPAMPATNPGTWLTPSDYPRDLLAEGKQGMVQVRLSVGPDGRPTQCHIQQSTRPVGFEEAVCKGLMRKSRFEPALGAQGQPIASYWRTAVKFDAS